MEALQAKAAQRRADKIRESQSVQDPGDVPMGGIGEPITVWYLLEINIFYKSILIIIVQPCIPMLI